MLVRVAVLADYASLSVGHKLNILGIFTSIFAPEAPIRHAHMQLVIQMEFDPSEAGSKQARTVLVDADGRELLAIGGQIEVARPAGPDPVTINQVLSLNGVVFPSFGAYEFKFLLNDELKAVVPLRVLKVDAPRPQGE